MYSEKYGTEKVRVLTLEKNRGKGGAVRMVGVIYIYVIYIYIYIYSSTVYVNLIFFIVYGLKTVSANHFLSSHFLKM